MGLRLLDLNAVQGILGPQQICFASLLVVSASVLVSERVVVSGRVSVEKTQILSDLVPFPLQAHVASAKLVALICSASVLLAPIPERTFVEPPQPPSELGPVCLQAYLSAFRRLRPSKTTGSFSILSVPIGH
jgi:hypothetical protein